MTTAHASRLRPNAIWPFFFAFFLCGCHGGESDDYKTWAPPVKIYSPRADSNDAFDAYALAATGAEDEGAKYLGRVSFFPGQRKEVEDKIAQRVKAVMAASGKPCEFQFVPHKPFQVVPFQAGWRLIGRAIEWQVEDGCQAADFDKAVRATVAGTRFGFDLTGGGATDVSLGLAIADDVRKAIAPYLSKMTPVQLDRLAQGLKAALASKPPISKAIGNERQDMLTAIQFLQDSLKSDDLKMVKKNLGTDVDEAVKYLKALRENAHKRTKYFDDLAKEGDAEFAAVESDAALPCKPSARKAPKRSRRHGASSRNTCLEPPVRCSTSTMRPSPEPGYSSFMPS